MSTSPVPAQTPPPAGAVEFVATDRTARELGVAVLKYRWSRPLTWASNAVIVIALLAFGIVNDQLWVSLVLLILVLPVITSMQYLSTARQMSGLYRAGTRHWTHFGDRVMTVGGPMGVSEFTYDSIGDVWTTNAAVLLRLKELRSVALMPAALFPAAQLAKVRERVGRPGATK